MTETTRYVMTEHSFQEFSKLQTPVCADSGVAGPLAAQGGG